MQTDSRTPVSPFLRRPGPQARAAPEPALHLHTPDERDTQGYAEHKLTGVYRVFSESLNCGLNRCR